MSFVEREFRVRCHTMEAILLVLSLYLFYIFRPIIQQHLGQFLYSLVCRDKLRERGANVEKLRHVRQEISSISAQDQFARWARLTRESDRLKAAINNSDFAIQRVKYSFVANVVCWIVVAFAAVLLSWTALDVGNTQGWGWLGDSVFSIPFAKSGTISASVVYLSLLCA